MQTPELDLELCSDAPYIAKNYENEPMMVMAGYFYARYSKSKSGISKPLIGFNSLFLS